MPREPDWYLCGSASSLSSSSMDSSWSRLGQYLDEDGIMDMKPIGPQNGLQFCRETIMAKVVARLTKPTAPSCGKPGGIYHPPEPNLCNHQKLAPIVGRKEKWPDLTSTASYGTSLLSLMEQPPPQERKKSRIPVPKKNMSGGQKATLPAIQMGNGLVAQNNPVIEAQPLERPQVKRLSKPKMAVCEALELLGNTDWEKKIAGLQMIRSLSVHHQDVAAPRVKDLHAAVIDEVKNLRSAVSRAAIVCLGNMFEGLKDKMLYGLNISVRILLQKSGECNTFLREAAEEALSSMALNIHPGRALAALIDGGLSHLNAAVRSCAAKHLHSIVLRSGADFILSDGKGITDRAIPAIARFAQDGCPEARMYGRNSLKLLAHHPRLMPMLKKYVTPQNLPSLKKTMKNIT